MYPDTARSESAHVVRSLALHLVLRLGSLQRKPTHLLHSIDGYACPAKWWRRFRVYYLHMRKIIVIAHDIRSTHNVGALLRTAECLGVAKLYFTGYTPYPEAGNDARLPHISKKLTQQIHKTALGTELTQPWEHYDDPLKCIAQLKADGYTVYALEQTAGSVELPTWSPPDKLALLIGREVEGIDDALLKVCDVHLEIPQFGTKESLNVVEATSMALYQARFAPFA